MRVFNKKETLIRTISFMAFFVAINVICSFLTTVLPLVSVVMVIFLPLTSAIVEVTCKDRWFPIYAFATIGLSIVVSLSSIDFTIFYIVPSIFTGYIFGLFSKHNFPRMFAIFLAAIVQTVLSLLFIPILQLITGSNLIDVLVKILRISDRIWFETIIILVFFIVALVQVILSYIVVENELNKFGQKTEEISSQEFAADCSSLGAIFLSIVLSFFYFPLSYLLIGISFYFAVFTVIYQFKTNNKKCLVADGVSLLIGLIVYAALNKYLKAGQDFVLFTITPGLISIVSILHSFLKKS